MKGTEPIPNNVSNPSESCPPMVAQERSRLRKIALNSIRIGATATLYLTAVHGSYYSDDLFTMNKDPNGPMIEQVDECPAFPVIEPQESREGIAAPLLTKQ